MGKELSINRELAEKITELAAMTAIGVYKAERRKENRHRTDRRLRDTKYLLRNYTQIKLHAGEAIASLSEIKQEDFNFFEDLMEQEERIDVAAIIRSKAKSAIMLSHIDSMLAAYKKMCENSPQQEEQRRYRVLEAMCLNEPRLTVDQIAEQENVDIRTVYRDYDTACEKMSALLFGIQWIERV